MADADRLARLLTSISKDGEEILYSGLVLNQKGVEAKIHYPVPLCLQSPYKKQNNKHICTNAIKHSKELLTLPIHQYLRRNQLEYTVNCIKSFYGK